jgi:hypothetical protein
MCRAMFSRIFLMILSATLVAGCASTNSVMEWQDEAWSGKLDNILVIAAVEDNAHRRSIEDAYVEEFAAISVGATPGYTLISSTTALSRETVEAAIAGQDLDAVLVTRLAGVDEVEEYQPPNSYAHYRSYHGYYSHSMRYSNPGYYRKYQVLMLETNLYDTATRELIWSMQSESLDASAPQKVIDGQIALTIKRMVARGLVDSAE